MALSMVRMASRPAAARCLATAAGAGKGGLELFQWNDGLMLGDQLTEEETMVAQSARDYCQSELMPRVVEANRHEKFDQEIMKEFGQLGLLGATIDGYGCSGVGYVSYGLIAREVERVSFLRPRNYTDDSRRVPSWPNVQRAAPAGWGGGSAWDSGSGSARGGVGVAFEEGCSHGGCFTPTLLSCLWSVL